MFDITIVASPSSSQHTLVSPSAISLPFASIAGKQVFSSPSSSPISPQDSKSLGSASKQSSLDAALNSTVAPFLPATSATAKGWKVFHSNVWRRRFDIAIMVLAVVLLLAWIVAAAVLATKKVFLPLDAFGDGIVTADSYNVIVSVLSAVLSIAVGAAIARGARSLIRRNLEDKHGLSVENYDALVNFADGCLSYRLNWTALGVFAVFIVAQLLSPASQAAFGQSPSTRTSNDSFNFTRLADNLSFANNSVELIVNSFSSADVDKSATQAMLSVPTRRTAGSDNFSATVFDTIESSSSTTPLFDSSLPQERLAGFERRTGTDVAADVTIETPVEAFLVNASCTDVNGALPLQTRATNATMTVEIEPRCGAGNRTFTWSRRSTVFIGDVHACDSVDGPLVYVLQASSTSAQMSFIYECSLAGSSVVVPVTIVPRNNSAFIVGDSTDRVDLPSSFPLGELLGADLNSFGSGGWPAVTRVLGGANVGLDTEQLAQRLVETSAKIELVHAQYLTASLADESFNMSTRTAQISFTALKIHLHGRQLAWFIVPSLLLFLVLSLAYVLFTSGPAASDFTDPVTTALVGLSSPQNRRVSSFATVKVEGATRIRFAEVRGRSSGVLVGGGGGQDEERILEVVPRLLGQGRSV